MVAWLRGNTSRVSYLSFLGQQGVWLVSLGCVMTMKITSHLLVLIWVGSTPVWVDSETGN